MSEMVVENGGRNRREQADGRCNQSVGDAGADRAKAGSAFRAETLECADDPDDSAQQTNKRRDRSNGCKPVETLFETRKLFVYTDLQTARDGIAVGNGAAALHLAADFLVSVIEDREGWRRAELFARDHDGFE